ncbi:MAG: FKBP-type peptidyl-prolyl cis-trans isomerase [Betaproteobacteria bacterium]|nr:FKBP-type peptidyl-prolyl cis-trans isomerase [Betaproteobacteria bacterium]
MLLGTAAQASARQQVEHVDAIPDTAPTKTLVIDRKLGDGREARRAEYVVLDYDGFVFDPSTADHKGVPFDSTKKHGHPVSVIAGTGHMIPGLDRGVLGMKVGGERTIVVPPKMGYGDATAFGVVPPQSTLIFEVRLLDVVPKGASN